jgi:hypothetical protein
MGSRERRREALDEILYVGAHLKGMAEALREVAQRDPERCPTYGGMANQIEEQAKRLDAALAKMERKS